MAGCVVLFADFDLLLEGFFTRLADSLTGFFAAFFVARFGVARFRLRTGATGGTIKGSETRPSAASGM